MTIAMARATATIAQATNPGWQASRCHGGRGGRRPDGDQGQGPRRGEADRPADDLEAPTVGHVVSQGDPGPPAGDPDRGRRDQEFHRIEQVKPPAGLVPHLGVPLGHRDDPRLDNAVCRANAGSAPAGLLGSSRSRDRRRTGTPRDGFPAGDLVVNHPSCSLDATWRVLVPGRGSASPAPMVGFCGRARGRARPRGGRVRCLVLARRCCSANRQPRYSTGGRWAGRVERPIMRFMFNW